MTGWGWESDQGLPVPEPEPQVPEPEPQVPEPAEPWVEKRDSRIPTDIEPPDDE